MIVHRKMGEIRLEERFLNRLSREYPTLQKAAAEVINLSAILSLPKGTEYFFSDLHGEYDAFVHLLNSASGMIRNKINICFENSLQESDRRELANLIYYPDRHLKQIHESDVDFADWLRVKVHQLLAVIRLTAEKYTRSKVRKKAPPDFAYLLDELLYSQPDDYSAYYSRLLGSVLEAGMGDALISGMCTMIQNLSIDMLHIIGDIYDRGPHADRIMDRLMQFDDLDMQWGNHDICWMGAACGNLTCIAAVLCSAIRYNSFDLLEDGYGINLRALNVFAAETYRDDPCTRFVPHILDENQYDPIDVPLAAKMHKAMAVIQCKLEGQLYRRHPEYEMDGRSLLSRVNFADGTVQIDDVSYRMPDIHFPTVDPADPLALSPGETELMDTIACSFRHSERLQKHIRFLYAKGSMFRRINGNLLFHGCIPMTKDGTFESVQIGDGVYSGRAYLEKIDQIVKNALFSSHHYNVPCDARDFLWYLWCGPKSPLFGKNKMATFEHYFVSDSAGTVTVEEMNPYYHYIEDQAMCERILAEFGLDPQTAHIINGHVPVKIGENPVKASGKLFVIDGGISKAYRSKTGIGGYTLIFNSRYLALAEHKPFVDFQTDMSPTVNIVEQMPSRVLVADTDRGREISADIRDLKELMRCYQNGTIKERL